MDWGRGGAHQTVGGGGLCSGAFWGRRPTSGFIGSCGPTCAASRSIVPFGLPFET